MSQIADPPKKLYCRGNLSLLNSSCLAVVGTRKLTDYGREAAATITRDLAASGFTIVSGLAMGIDAIAHQTTLENNGKTIAVLGGGVSNKDIGPRTNYSVAQNILNNNGLLISEYSGKERIYAANFAARDRIISGLSKGVLVVEGDHDSGALITAKCALDQNRDVFAIPGNIFSSRSAGPNWLIRNGAKLISSAHDIIEEYGYNLKLFEEAKMSVTDPVEKKVLEILAGANEINTDNIIRASQLQTQNVLTALSMLEIKGFIKNLGNGKYRKA